VSLAWDEEAKEQLLEDFGGESVGIIDAYAELTRPAFAVWIRLMAMTPEQLTLGRDFLAKQLGYSEPGASQVLKELSRKAYLKVDSGGPFLPTQFILIKRLILKGDDHVITLG